MMISWRSSHLPMHSLCCLETLAHSSCLSLCIAVEPVSSIEEIQTRLTIDSFEFVAMATFSTVLHCIILLREGGNSLACSLPKRGTRDSTQQPAQ
jgi:hypothetical protein